MYSYWNSSSLELENSRNHLHKGSERITSFLPLPILRNTLFFSFLPFYLNIIALQSYVSEFLLYSKVNQLYVRVCAYIYTYTYIYIYIPSLLSLPPMPPPSYPSRSSQSIEPSPLCYIAASQWLSILHKVMYVFQYYSVNSSHPLLPPLCP